jgi:hypothetical protein
MPVVCGKLKFSAQRLANASAVLRSLFPPLAPLHEMDERKSAPKFLLLAGNRVGKN